MDIKEWRKLALQCTLLLGAVWLFSMCYSYRERGDRGITVHAENQGVLVSDPITGQTVERIEVVYSRKSYIENISDTFIRIPKAKDCTPSAIYLDNQYMDESICLSIEGAEKGEYSGSQIERIKQGSVYQGKIKRGDLAQRQVVKSGKTEDGVTEVTQITIRFHRLFEPELYETANFYYITLQEPKHLYDKIIVVDAGHGGMDEGTMSQDKKYKEKEYTLQVVKNLKEYLDESDCKVYYTRLSDVNISKKKRTRLANQTQADLFVSVHCNASNYGDTTAYGMEALFSGRKEASSEYMTSKKFSSILLDSVTEQTGKRKRGIIQRNGLYLMNHSKVPVSIIEIGYMSNRSDLRYLLKEKNQKEIARGIYEGLHNALNVISQKEGHSND